MELLLNGYDPLNNAIEFPLELYDDDLHAAASAISECVKPEEYLECYESMNSGNFWRLCFDGKNVEEVYPDFSGIFDEHPFEDLYPSEDMTGRIPASVASGPAKEGEIKVYLPLKGEPGRHVGLIITADSRICGGTFSVGKKEEYGVSVSATGSVSSLPGEKGKNMRKLLGSSFQNPQAIPCRH